MTLLALGSCPIQDIKPEAHIVASLENLISTALTHALNPYRPFFVDHS